MTNDGEFAADAVSFYLCQPVVSVPGDLGGAEPQKRHAGNGVPENDAQHVDLARRSSLSRHNFFFVASQEIAQRMRPESAGIHREVTPIELTFLLACPEFGVCAQPKCP
jgi:hypothetical protein